MAQVAHSSGVEERVLLAQLPGGEDVPVAVDDLLLSHSVSNLRFSQTQLSLTQQTLAALRLLYKQGMLTNVQKESERANARVGRAVARLRGGMSQAELAERLADQLEKKSVDPTTITRIESGKRTISVDELEAFANIFNVKVEDLLDDEIAAQMAMFNDKYREVVALHSEYQVVRQKLFEASNYLREKVLDLETRDEEIIERLGPIGVRNIQNLLEGIQFQFSRDWGYWPFKARENESGEVEHWRINLDGTKA